MRSKQLRSRERSPSRFRSRNRRTPGKKPLSKWLTTVAVSAKRTSVASSILFSPPRRAAPASACPRYVASRARMVVASKQSRQSAKAQSSASICLWKVRARSEKRSEERRVGKSVDLGGRRIIKKKKKKKTLESRERAEET